MSEKNRSRGAIGTPESTVSEWPFPGTGWLEKREVDELANGAASGKVDQHSVATLRSRTEETKTDVRLEPV